MALILEVVMDNRRKVVVPDASKYRAALLSRSVAPRGQTREEAARAAAEMLHRSLAVRG
jgi:hypothetical protein